MPKFDSAFLFALEDSKIDVSTVKDLQPYSIGVLRDDIAEDAVVKLNIPGGKIIKHSDINALIKMLVLGRIDLLAYGELSVPLLLRQQGYSSKKVKKIFSLDTGDSYFAFIKNTPPGIVERYQKSFDDLKKKGIVKKSYP